MQAGTDGHPRVWQNVEDGKAPAKEARTWRIEGLEREKQKKRVSEASKQVRNGRFYGAKRIMELVREKILRERGALPKEESDAIGEYKAMNEEHFLISWLREDGREKEEKMVKVSNLNEEK